MPKFNVHIPGNFYAFTYEADDERAVRAKVRESLGCSRLPAGTAVWESTPLPPTRSDDASRYHM